MIPSSASRSHLSDPLGGSPTEAISIKDFTKKFGSLNVSVEHEDTVNDANETAEALKSLENMKTETLFKNNQGEHKDLSEEKANEIEPILENCEATVITKNKAYGHEEIKNLINLLQTSDVNVVQAAKACGIPRSSAYSLWRQYKSNPTVIPGFQKKVKANSPRKKIFPEHTDFIIKTITDNPYISLEELKTSLYKEFPNMNKVTNVAMIEHIRRKCNFTRKSM